MSENKPNKKQVKKKKQIKKILPPPIPMQQMNNNMNALNIDPFGVAPIGGHARNGPTPLGRISVIKDSNMKKDPKDLDVASVIVTICDGPSYDNLFRNIPQESEYGRVAVYLVKPGHILNYIQRSLQGEAIDKFTVPKTDNKLDENQRKLLKDLKADCLAAGADAVCFNWECCGSYSQAGFCQGNHGYTGIYMDFIAYLVKEFGCMTMFSDFSLKALIKDWDGEKLGPNPFKQIGSFGGNMTINFDTEQLKNCASAQLNTVGSLSEGGQAQLHAMGGTILFTMSSQGNELLKESQAIAKAGGSDPLTNAYLQPYEVEMLSVASMCSLPAFTNNKLKEVDEDKDAARCQIGDKQGLAGHVLLTYPPSESSLERFKVELKEQEEAREIAIKENTAVNLEDEDQILPARGMILASCGHWVELMKIDVNVKRLLETVKNDWGEEADNYQEMNTAMASMNVAEQREYSTQKAVKYVQSRAPAKFNKVLKRKKKNGY